MALHTHRQGGFNNHTMHSLYTIIIMAATVMGMMKMGNIAPRLGLKPTSLVFQAIVFPLHLVGSLTSPLYSCLPVYLFLVSEVSTYYYTRPPGIVNVLMLIISLYRRH